MKWIWFLFGSLALFYCSDDPRERSFAYLKSPDGFLTPTEFEEDSPDPQKYILTWRNPSEKEKFQNIRIYLDTTNWKEILEKPEKSIGAVLTLKPTQDSTVKSIDKKTNDTTWNKFIVEEDSILFSFGDSGDPVQLMEKNYKGYPWYQFDTSGMGARLDSVDYAFNFALVSVYPGDIGIPRFTEIIVDDRFPPEKLQSQRSVTDKSFTLSWKRPRDKTSFFNNDPASDSGHISGYHLILKNVEKTDEPLTTLKIDSMVFVREKDSLFYSSGRSKNPGFKVTRLSSDTGKIAIYDIFLEDGNGYSPNQSAMYFQILGLKDLHQYSYQFYAVDEFGNRGTRGAELLTFNTTDTSKPRAIENFKADSIGINIIELSWSPTRDSRPDDTKDNQNIMSYHLVKTKIPDSSSQAKPESLVINIEVSPTAPQSIITNQSRILTPDSESDLYRAYFYYLAPGQKFDFKLYAEDSTQHKSDISSLSVTTLFADTGYTCPTGYKLIAKGNNTPFCIEELEHQDSSGNFMSAVTISEAAQICGDVADEADSLSQHYLCTEQQWVRACRGREEKHVYGIQSLDNLGNELGELSASSSLLQTHCNQGAGDIDMAFDIRLRNSVCITNEGVRDLAGNLSEWVAAEDSGQLTPMFKGGNYLKPQISVADLQKKAQCTALVSRPKQKRPAYVPSCVSEFVNVAVRYKHPSNVDSVFCPEISSPVVGKPEFKKGEETINGKKLEKDSVYMTLNFKNGESKEYKIRNIGKADSNALNGVEINQKVLLEVLFSKEEIDSLKEFGSDSNLEYVLDTLDYREFSYSDTLVLDGAYSEHPLLTREVNGNWKSFPTKLLYGYIKNYPEEAVQNFKDAKEFYQFKAIGFRCCAAAIPKAPPVD